MFGRKLLQTILMVQVLTMNLSAASAAAAAAATADNVADTAAPAWDDDTPFVAAG